MKNELIAANGSVQALDVPQEVKDLYKTTWEIKQKVLIDMAADRAQHPSSSALSLRSGALRQAFRLRKHLAAVGWQNQGGHERMPTD